MTFPRTVVTLFYHKSALFSTEKERSKVVDVYIFICFLVLKLSYDIIEKTFIKRSLNCEENFTS